MSKYKYCLFPTNQQTTLTISPRGRFEVEVERQQTLPMELHFIGEKSNLWCDRRKVVQWLISACRFTIVCALFGEYLKVVR